MGSQFPKLKAYFHSCAVAQYCKADAPATYPWAAVGRVRTASSQPAPEVSQSTAAGHELPFVTYDLNGCFLLASITLDSAASQCAASKASGTLSGQLEAFVRQFLVLALLKFKTHSGLNTSCIRALLCIDSNNTISKYCT